MLIFINSGFSQIFDEFKTNYNRAINFVAAKNFQSALPIFLSLDSTSSGNSNLDFNVGVCYINSSLDKSKAIPFLERAVENISLDYIGLPDEITAPIFAFYYLGRAYMIDNRIDDAINLFEKFKYYLTDSQVDLLKDVNHQIEMCYNAKKLMSNPVEIKIDNLGEPINSAYPDYSPVLSIDESAIYFTSRREGSNCGKKDTDGKFFEDIYTAVYDKNQNKWIYFRKIDKINTCGHEASISLSADGKQLFIYKDDKGDGNIYISNLVNDNWTTPEKLPSEINTKAWETHACLTTDGNTLYFTSNKEGGYGGRDIYMCEKLESGKWSNSVNLGPAINTEYDEESPFILPDGVTLYFSSKGHECMGGFDIFTSTLSDEGYWSTPENIGYPINTTDDDVFYVPTKDEKHAYYSSAKGNGFGDQDIYKLSIITQKKLVAHLKGLIMDESTYKPVAAKLEVIDAVTNNIIARFTSDNESGAYYVSLPIGKTYNLKVSAEKYITHNETFNISDTISDPEINKVIILQKMQIASKDTKIMFDNKEVLVGDRIVLNNVLFDFDKYTLRPESKVELDKWVAFLKNYSTLKIELLGHTDNKGVAEYNIILSENRAKAVCDYFVENGINIERLKWKGYGMGLPIATNLTDEGRQKNRRTEIKIISRY